MQTWQRNLYTLWVAELMAVAGFTVVLPFLPYYVQELGVTELEQVELWSGLLFASKAIAMAIFSPIWGSVAHLAGLTQLHLEAAEIEVLEGGSHQVPRPATPAYHFIERQSS